MARRKLDRLILSLLGLKVVPLSKYNEMRKFLSLEIKKRNTLIESLKNDNRLLLASMIKESDESFRYKTEAEKFKKISEQKD